MSKFEIDGVVKYAPKGIGFKLEERETGRDRKEHVTLHEVLCFDKALMEQIQEGDHVTVKGRIGRRQVQDAKRVYNGKEYDVWTPQLIVTAVFPAGDARAPAGRQTPPRHRATSAREEFGDDEPGF